MITSSQLKNQIESGVYDRSFERLYGAGPAVNAQRGRYVESIEAFEQHYGQGREVALYSTPGRTEIGGNHTDHENGTVLAAAVNLDIIAVVAKNTDDVIRVTSKGFNKSDEIDLCDLAVKESEKNTSAALIRGVVAGLKKRGGQVGGFDAYTTSDVLKGSGLSSSAAFEVCVGSILNGEYNDGVFGPVELAQNAQYAENEYFGKPSGLMDQTACAVGSAISIDFADPATPIVERIPFDLAGFGYSLVITDSKADHADLTGEYAAVREDMLSVARQFGKSVLRDVPEADFLAAITELRKKTSDRAVLRALHFYADTRRAKEMALCLKEKDLDGFLQRVVDGGHSSFEYNQNAYSLQTPLHQAVPLALALSQRVLSGRGGAWRLQGGGFAGTIQAFVPNALLAEYTGLLGSVFGEDACHVLSIREDGCVRVLPV